MPRAAPNLPRAWSSSASSAAPAVMGNSDHFLLTLDPGEEAVTEVQLDSAKWSQSQLSDDLRAFHESFTPTVEVDLGDGRTLLAFHGTPRSRDEMIGPWTEEEAFREPFDGHDAAVFAGGHTHQQWSRRLGGAYYLNPGSVGLAVRPPPGARGPSAPTMYAEYAIVEAADGRIDFQFRRVPFEPAAVLEAIEASGMPHPEPAARTWR